jgi:hypothetical protein
MDFFVGLFYSYMYLGFYFIRLVYSLRSYSNAVKNYCASCWAFPKNLHFFFPIALFSFEGTKGELEFDTNSSIKLLYSRATSCFELFKLFT